MVDILHAAPVASRQTTTQDKRHDKTQWNKFIKFVAPLFGRIKRREYLGCEAESLNIRKEMKNHMKLHLPAGVALLAASSLGLAACGMPPSPVDALVPEVKIEGSDTRDACEAIAEGVGAPALTRDEAIENWSTANAPVDKAAKSEASGRALSSAWDDVWTSVGAGDRARADAAFADVFEVCESVGMNMGWEE